MMDTPETEARDPRYGGLDTWRDEAILSALLEGQQRSLNAVAQALPELARAARAAAERLQRGGRLIYLGAGSAGLMALADALEIPQTFGLSAGQTRTVLADGPRIAESLNGEREDNDAAARADMAAIAVNAKDCVIAVSASGRTPYTVAGLRAAKAAGALTVGLAGLRGSPLFMEADIGVELHTGAEVISGSTRLSAGTAQKAALNLISTLMAVRLGHVYDGLMVNLRADNAKLRGRAARMVMLIAGVDEPRALAALETSGGKVKEAALIAAGCAPEDVEALLTASNGNLRQALAVLDPA